MRNKQDEQYKDNQKHYRPTCETTEYAIHMNPPFPGVEYDITEEFEWTVD